MRITLRVVIAVLAALIVTSCGSDDPATKAKPSSEAAKPKPVEVKYAVFVLNPDKTATLSATVVNNTDSALTMPAYPEASLGSDEEFLHVRSYNPGVRFQPGESTTLGHADDLLIRLAKAPPVEVPVVDRTTHHISVLGTKPNTKITVEDGTIVVVPGQKEAVVDGRVVSSVTDNAYELPTANDEQGNLVAYRHHTATGGPYGIHAEKGKSVRIASAPPIIPDGENMGDFDYFDAEDVTIGEKITVNIPFQSGDVIAIFTVVAG